MITATEHKVNQNIIHQIAKINFEGKLSVNKPTGNFFYDPWELLDEYKNSAIDIAISSLGIPVGETRLIKLKSGNCYFSHSDIDDRYHLNISGDCSALVNLDTQENFFLSTDGVWYFMDAGPRHSAVNFGQFPRIQLVVRKLLKKNSLEKPVTLFVEPQGTNARFVFDNTISPWLNRAVKQSKINNFYSNGKSITVDVDDKYLDEFLTVCPKNFTVRFPWQL